MSTLYKAPFIQFRSITLTWAMLVNYAYIGELTVQNCGFYHRISLSSEKHLFPRTVVAFKMISRGSCNTHAGTHRKILATKCEYVYNVIACDPRRLKGNTHMMPSGSKEEKRRYALNTMFVCKPTPNPTATHPLECRKLPEFDRYQEISLTRRLRRPMMQ